LKGSTAELQELAHRVFLSGGLLVNIVHMARRKAEREKTIQRVKDALAEIDATGVQVKDLEMGLLRLSLQGGRLYRTAVLETG